MIGVSKIFLRLSPIISSILAGKPPSSFPVNKQEVFQPGMLVVGVSKIFLRLSPIISSILVSVTQESLRLISATRGSRTPEWATVTNPRSRQDTKGDISEELDRQDVLEE